MEIGMLAQINKVAREIHAIEQALHHLAGNNEVCFSTSDMSGHLVGLIITNLETELNTLKTKFKSL